MKKYLISICVAVIFGISPTAAQLVINTAQPERPVTLGVRAGGNVSNTSSNEMSLMPTFGMYAPNWKGGFTGGVVVNLNIREYISIQPGFFYSSASHGFKRMSIGPNEEGYQFVTVTTSNSTAHYFQVPVMASFKMECGPHIKLLAEAGPYFAWGVGGNEKYVTNRYNATPENPADRTHKRDYFGSEGVGYTFDWGFKMGVGVSFGRFVIGAHYLAGCRDVLRPTACIDPNSNPMLCAGVKGYNKMWQFTIGYDF